MSFKKSFEKKALIPVPERYNDLYEDSAVNYFKLVHSPWLSGAKAAIKVGLPVAAIAAIASPKLLRLRNAAGLGAIAGGIAGLSAFGEQQYSNMLEKAHLRFHLEE